MKKQIMTLAGIPAILYGSRSRKVYLYLHGKNGCKEEAERFAATACEADVYKRQGCFCSGQGTFCTAWWAGRGWNRCAVRSARRWDGWAGTRFCCICCTCLLYTSRCV